MKKLLLILCLFAAGCASIPQGVVDVATSPKTFTTCGVTDTLTTIAIIKAGGVELNPIVAPLLTHGFLPFIAMNVAIIWVAWQIWDDLHPAVQATLNAVECSMTPHNLTVLSHM